MKFDVETKLETTLYFFLGYSCWSWLNLYFSHLMLGNRNVNEISPKDLKRISQTLALDRNHMNSNVVCIILQKRNCVFQQVVEACI